MNEAREAFYRGYIQGLEERHQEAMKWLRWLYDFSINGDIHEEGNPDCPMCNGTIKAWLEGQS